MVAFFDSSAIIKRYIKEIGSEIVDDLIDRTETIIVGPLTSLECLSGIRRVLEEGKINNDSYIKYQKEIDYDLIDVIEVPYNEELKAIVKEVIDKYQLKTLDAIQLAACLLQKNIIDIFICCDKRLNRAAEQEEIKVINPLHKK
ncbi:hypothetical protein ES703_86483 [subsurface metagenome]